jgi:putative sterol carrier protein
MGSPFPSQAWTDAFVEIVNTSDAYASAAKTWEGDITFVVEEGGGIYLDLWHGTCRAGEYLADPLGKPAEFKITTTKDKWRQVITGKLDPIQAMVTRQIKLDGNLVKIMKNVKAAQELVRCATQVDTDFA